MRKIISKIRLNVSDFDSYDFFTTSRHNGLFETKGGKSEFGFDLRWRRDARFGGKTRGLTFSPFCLREGSSQPQRKTGLYNHPLNQAWENSKKPFNISGALRRTVLSISCSLMTASPTPQAKFETSEKALTQAPLCFKAIASHTVDIPTAESPTLQTDPLRPAFPNWGLIRLYKPLYEHAGCASEGIL